MRTAKKVIAASILLLAGSCGLLFGHEWYVTRGFDGPRPLTDAPHEVNARQPLVILPEPPLRTPGPQHELCVAAQPPTELPLFGPKVFVTASGDTARLQLMLATNAGERQRLLPEGGLIGREHHLCFFPQPADSSVRYIRLELSTDYPLTLQGITWFSGQHRKYF
jgi:hypothetical protein